MYCPEITTPVVEL